MTENAHVHLHVHDMQGILPRRPSGHLLPSSSCSAVLSDSITVPALINAAATSTKCCSLTLVKCSAELWPDASTVWECEFDALDDPLLDGSVKFF